MGLPRWLLGLGLIGALSLATNVSFAEPAAEPSEFVWKWPRFRTSEYITTGVVGAAALGVFFFAGLRDEPRWTGGILFDDAVRDAVRIRSRDGTATVRRLSDVTAIGVLVLTLGVDSLAVPLLRGSSDVAGQLLLLDAEALAPLRERRPRRSPRRLRNWLRHADVAPLHRRRRTTPRRNRRRPIDVGSDPRSHRPILTHEPPRADGPRERAFQITDCSQDPYWLSPAISLRTSPDRYSSHALASRMRPAM
jgi:hypothetical protein